MRRVLPIFWQCVLFEDEDDNLFKWFRQTKKWSQQTIAIDLCQAKKKNFLLFEDFSKIHQGDNQ